MILRTARRPIRSGTVLRVAGRLLVALIAATTALESLRRAVAGDGTTWAVPSPGAIGAMPRSQPGTRPDRRQDVTLEGPRGLEVAVEAPGGWSRPVAVPARLDLPVGRSCRLRLTGIPGYEGEELFPSVTVLAKLAAPPAEAWRFPVELVVTREDLAEAIDGAFVRRVVYSSCDCREAELPPPFDVLPGDDARDVAATLGEPVLELAIGNRLPSPGVTR